MNTVTNKILKTTINKYRNNSLNKHHELLSIYIVKTNKQKYLTYLIVNNQFLIEKPFINTLELDIKNTETQILNLNAFANNIKNNTQIIKNILNTPFSNLYIHPKLANQFNQIFYWIKQNAEHIKFYIEESDKNIDFDNYEQIMNIKHNVDQYIFNTQKLLQ